MLCAAGFISLLSALPLSHAADEVKCHYSPVGLITVKPGTHRPLAEGSINGNPISILIDTGAYSSSIFEPVAKRFDLPLSHSEALTYGMGGESEHYIAHIKNFTVGKIDAKSVRLEVTRDFDSRLHFDAIIGADFMMNQDLEIDLASGKIIFFRPKNCQDTFLGYWDGNAFLADLESPKNELHRSPVVAVELNGQKLRAMIDTGAPSSIVSLEAAKRVGITPESPGVTAGGKMGGIGSNRTETWIAKFDSFSLGDETVKNPRIPIGDLTAGIRADVKRNYVDEIVKEMPDMIIGTDFIAAHRMLFAVSQQRLYFTYLGGPVFYNDAPSEKATKATSQ